MPLCNFKNDYSLGCHPSILEALVESNNLLENGYGQDEFSEKARTLIRKEIGRPDADIYFISGGTQANLTCISAALQQHESVISANIGHINFEEAGAIEATGHKILTVEVDKDGKHQVEYLKKLLHLHSNPPHYLKPKMVYLANSTVIGTVYSGEELRRLSQFCKENGLYLYLDGARLASALMSENAHFTLKDIADCCDIFYIGGTKIGALLGEAIVIVNDQLKKDFHYHVKMRGAMLAKSRLLGIQFVKLFENRLFYTLGSHVNEMASLIKNALSGMGISFFSDSTTNQLFPIFPTSVARRIQEKYDCFVWAELPNDKVALRIVTSWSTQKEEVLQLIADIQEILSIESVHSL